MTRTRLYWYGPAIVWGVLILILTSIPRLQPPPLGIKLEDKIYHFIVYFIFGLLLSRSWSRGDITQTGTAIVKTLLLGGFFALADEIHQHFIPGRFCDYWDAAADLAGILLSVAIFARYRRFFIKQDRALSDVFIHDNRKYS